MSNYDLSKKVDGKTSLFASLAQFLPILKKEKKLVVSASIAALLSSGLNLLAPILIGRAVDRGIEMHNYHTVLVYAGVIFVIYICSVVANYFQTLLMGMVGQNVLYSLRGEIFAKLSILPIAFFNQNKAGDLISRINNDTDKLNQFFSQSLVQLAANSITIVGAAIFVLVINWKLGIIAIGPALVLLVFTQLVTPWIKDRNAANLRNIGSLSGEISESIDNFKVVVAFDRRDYFRTKFNEANERNYAAAVSAGVANNTLTPTYGLASNIAQLSVIAFGLALIASGNFTLGLLISFITYVSRVYDPLRQVAALWANFQTAFASSDRIHRILELDSNLLLVSDTHSEGGKKVVEFKDVSFAYPDGKEVLHHVEFALERGKTYALVGPTGGGKTTTASLIARLYDPTHGVVFLDGRDIRSYDDAARTKKIGFILQEPFLFSGSVRENIVYGHEAYQTLTNDELVAILREQGLESLLARFEGGLDMQVTATGNALSLGQKQLIAFIRAVLRKPELLILDEATANIDTVTEELLEQILLKLPAETTKVIIAHRLNTIENADEIFFVNSGEVVRAGSMEHALEMLLEGKRTS